MPPGVLVSNTSSPDCRRSGQWFAQLLDAGLAAGGKFNRRLAGIMLQGMKKKSRVGTAAIVLIFAA
jgi:hypothetical protein